MTKARFKSALFTILTVASLLSFFYLQSQRSSEEVVSKLPIIEEVEDSTQQETNSTLPDAAILKEIVKKGKKYILFNLDTVI